MKQVLRILDTGLAAARWNVAMTAALVQGHASGVTPDTLRFHRYCSCVLLGNGQSPASAVDLGYCRRNDIEIARRITGGGAVFMSPRMLAWDAVVAVGPFGRDLGAVTRRLCEAIAAGLSHLGTPARFRAPNDIEIGGLKVSGTSGYVEGRSAVLQGTVLIEDDIPTMAAALCLPEAILRQKVSCLAAVLGVAPAIEQMQTKIAGALTAALERAAHYAVPSEDELRATRQLLADAIGTDDYVMRERPANVSRGAP